MPSRRAFLSAGAAAIGLGAIAPGLGLDDEPTWLTYALDLETFWRRLPILDRLKAVAGAGFRHYEFGPFKAKDLAAIDKAGRELDLTPARFTAYSGIADPTRKGPFLEAFDDAIESAELIGCKRLTVVPGEVVAGLGRDEMIDAVVDALKEAGERAKEHDLIVLVGPARPVKGRPDPLIATAKSAAELVEAVGSPAVKLLVEAVAGADLATLLKGGMDRVGYVRLPDPSGSDAPADPSRTLKTIHDLAPAGPVGVEVGPRTDPADAIKRLRLADAAAKAIH